MKLYSLLKFVVWQQAKQFLYVKDSRICIILKREKNTIIFSGTYFNSFAKLLCKQIIYYLEHEVANFEYNFPVTELLLSILWPQYLSMCE